MGLPPLKAERRGLPVMAILVVALPALMTFAGFKYLQVHSMRPIGKDLKVLEENAKNDRADNAKQAEQLAQLERQVAALQAIAKVDIVWGDASVAQSKEVSFPYQHDMGSKVWIRPAIDSSSTVWYIADDGDTLARVAANPKVLGAAYLWPILANENGLDATDGTFKLKADQLIKVPNRIYEYQIRNAITKAGAPDKARDAIYKVAGLTP